MEFEPRLPVKVSPRFSEEKAHAMQLQLSRLLLQEDKLPENINYVAGVDVGYARGVSVGIVAVLDFDSLSLVETKAAHVKTRFPYIPTLLSFREVPPSYSAIKKLQTHPDVFLVDGQGFAHPYRLGFASHLGLTVEKPTIGVAKNLLCGKVGHVGEHGWAPLMDRGEIIGAEVESKRGTKPIYISIGHRVSLKRAVTIVMQCARTCRIPEPIRRAHIIASEEKRRILTHTKQHK